MNPFPHTQVSRGLIPVAGVVLLLGGCAPGESGGLTNQLQDLVSSITAPYALLNLDTGAVTYSNTVTAPASTPAYRNQAMVFRRVGSGTQECFVSICEVTQAHWDKIDPPRLNNSNIPIPRPWEEIHTNVVPASARDPDRPVYGIDLDTANTVLAAWGPGTARLSVPTPAQWHLAAGTTAGWTWGAGTTQEQLVANAWVNETIGSTRGPRDVGTKAASSLGFYDLHGNVWEWTSDGSMRGGSWQDNWQSSRAEAAPGVAEGITPEMTHALVGLRLVLIP
jgi:formylglycine-generating enzyme required for sulfatase activity